MANTYTQLAIHCVWSTKHREALIHPDWESELWAYLGGIARYNGIHPHKIGGVENHVHALLELPKDMAVANLVKLMKTGSSKWVNQKGIHWGKFYWQDGYGAFAVSHAGMAEVVEYIDTQRTHHHTKTFEEEYRELLDEYGIPYEEVYLFD